MVSRRRILSRSRDDLNLEVGPAFQQPEEEEDVWYHRDKLYKDHIQEVLDKWNQIDDEIWAKVIVLERNRRVAKAYARAPVLTINGSDDGFDGFRIGLCGFDNPMRDPKTEEFKKHIGHGVKVKMDDQGNILVKRVSKSNVYVKSTSNGEETSIGADVLKLPNCSLETDKPVKLFDMKKFQTNVSRELRRAYPDRRRLECQCLSAIAFVRSEQDLLECPIWVLIINVVAMDMLKSKLPPVKRPAVDIRNRPRIPVPDEDPYSVANGGGSSGSSGGGNGPQPPRRSDKPPKLPPRDNPQYQPHHIPKSQNGPLKWWKQSKENKDSKGNTTTMSRGAMMTTDRALGVLQPDYDDINEAEDGPAVGQAPVPAPKPFPSSRGKDKQKDASKHDDPYYCGLRARVPNFVKRKGPSGGNGVSKGELGSGLVPAGGRLVLPPPHMAPPQAHYAPQPAHHHPMMWHARSYDSGMDTELLESPYNHIYGRLPIPTRGYIPPSPRTMYIGEWD